MVGHPSDRLASCVSLLFDCLFINISTGSDMRVERRNIGGMMLVLVQVLVLHRVFERRRRRVCRYFLVSARRASVCRDLNHRLMWRRTTR